jgi:hypothetical protein
VGVTRGRKTDLRARAGEKLQAALRAAETGEVAGALDWLAGARQTLALIEYRDGRDATAFATPMLGAISQLLRARRTRPA